MEAVFASAAALADLAGVGVDRSDPAGAGQPGAGQPGTDAFETGQPGTDSLRDADPLRAFADACLDGLAELARLESGLAALKVRLSTDYVHAAGALVPCAASPQDRAAQQMAAVAEVACVLTVGERTAGALLSDGQALTAALPLTLSALQAGEISWQHARIIVDETTGLDRAGAAALEAHFLDPDAPDPARGCRAGDLVASRFRAKARAWRERHHPLSIETRHANSAADRRVEYVPDRDGMAWLSAYLRADTAAGIWDRCTAAARALQGPDEARTLAQLRADTTAAWLLTGGSHNTGTGAGRLQGRTPGTGTSGGGAGWAGEVPSPRAQVLVTVPVLSLLGATDEPAVLDGYGPIPPSMARRLVTDGADSFYRVLTDPRDGTPLEIGRTSYRLTTAQRRWLRLRDGKCPFPGCNNHSLDNEADHLLAWADGGSTGISNLGQPCPKHHRLKHRSAWTPTGASKDHPPGWTSPSGRHYPSEHQDWEPPHWPPQSLPAQDPGQDPAQDPGDVPGPEPGLPADPFPDWHQFVAAQSPPAGEMFDPYGSGAHDNDPFPDSLLLQDALPTSSVP
ncbi:HNH endonuclease signature motif containing protein [Arthrobacter sp. ov118]|uniref:HNH endonuclease signature motif containing protein n=1 Tax=Arthrobacter sp. ov118 TaxID=1761747 RepID=UPI0008E9BB4F|nr:HNH endonuclease signature motif containing protein [Arthrobacter sp. ov118]SFT68867.1 protein of unknown function [Arthrobacter sp. ov118]